MMARIEAGKVLLKAKRRIHHTWKESTNLEKFFSVLDFPIKVIV